MTRRIPAGLAPLAASTAFVALLVALPPGLGQSPTPSTTPCDGDSGASCGPISSTASASTRPSSSSSAPSSGTGRPSETTATAHRAAVTLHRHPVHWHPLYVVNPEPVVFWHDAHAHAHATHDDRIVLTINATSDLDVVVKDRTVHRHVLVSHEPHVHAYAWLAAGPAEGHCHWGSSAILRTPDQNR